MIPGPGPSVSRHSERHCNVYNTRSHSTAVAERAGGPGSAGGWGELGGVQEEEEEEEEQEDTIDAAAAAVVAAAAAAPSDAAVCLERQSLVLSDQVSDCGS